MDPMETNLRNLAAAAMALPETDPVERARRAKALINQTAAVLARVRRAAIVEALAEGRTYVTVHIRPFDAIIITAGA